MPDNVVGDRLDRVQVGQQVHVSPPVLGEATPDEDWLTVTDVASDGAMVTVTHAAGSFTGRVNQLIRIGWQSP